MTDVLNVLMRWLHISSVVVLIGGVLFARFVLAPALALAAGARNRIRSARPWPRVIRSLLYSPILLLTRTGFTTFS